MSNQTRLFILVLLAFLPTVGLYWHANRSLEAAELTNQETELLHLANRAGLEYRRILDDSEALLGALAEMSEFRNPRQPECNQALAGVMSHMEYYTNIQLIEVDGFVACGSLAIGESLFVGDRYYHRAALTNRQFTVGNFVIGRITSKPIVGLAQPITGASPTDVSAVLTAYLDLTELGNSVYQMDVPRGATFTVIDRNGQVMVRIPAGQSETGADTVGATVPDAFPTPTGDIVGPYLLEGIDLDGMERRFAVEPLRAGGTQAYGHVLIGIDEASMLAATDLVASRQLQILAVAALFLFFLAWMFGHYTLLRDSPSPASADTGMTGTAESTPHGEGRRAS